MLRGIGIIGYGFVGKACHSAFKHNTTAIIVDPLYPGSSTIDNLIAEDPPVIFVCLPAPTLDSGDIDLSIIEDVLCRLVKGKYRGIVILKSTIPPYAIEYITSTYSLYSNQFKPDNDFLHLVYSPEFLRELTWEHDALNPDMIILSGSLDDCRTVELMYRNHSHIKSDVIYYKVGYDEASLIKYAINSFLALKVSFFNQLYQYYKDVHDDGKDPHPELWSDFIRILATDKRIGNTHMSVPGNDGKLGYGGSCFPKDVKALLKSDVFGHLSILKEAELYNTKIRLTSTNSLCNNIK